MEEGSMKLSIRSKESTLVHLLSKGTSPRIQSDHEKIHHERASSSVVGNLIKKEGRNKR